MRAFLTGLVLVGTFASPGAARCDPVAEPPVLVSGRSRSGSVGPEESRRFRAELKGNGTWKISLQQDGINLLLAVTDPRGETTTSASPQLRQGRISRILRPATPGRYRIEVRCEEKGVRPGSFEIRLEPLDAGGSTAALEAEESLSLAGRLYREGSRPSLERALELYRTAARRWGEAGQLRGQAEALDAAAYLSSALGDARAALESYRRTLPLWRDLGLPLREASALNNLGLAHWKLRELEEAGASLEKGLGLYRELGYLHGEALALNNLCLVTHARGALREVLPCYREAETFFLELGETGHRATVLNNLGFAYHSLAEPHEALERYHLALELRQGIGDREGEAQTLNNIAVLLRGMGEVQDAISHYVRAREIQAALANRRQEAAALHNLGVAFNSLGDPGRALPYLQEALGIRRQIEDPVGVLKTLTSLGRIHRSQGRPAEALTSHREAVELAEKVGRDIWRALALRHLGETLLKTGHPTEALVELQRARAIHSRTGDRRGLGALGQLQARALFQLERPHEALPVVREALELSEILGDRPLEVDLRVLLAQIQRALGEPREARHELETALALVEALRGKLLSPEFRSTFLAARIRAFELRVEWLMEAHLADPKAGFDREALELSERSRARTLLDLLHGDRARRALEVEPGLLREQRRLGQALSAKVAHKLRLSNRGPPEEEALRRLDAEIRSLRVRLDEGEAAIRRSSPKYEAVAGAQSLSVSELQGALGDDTTLLEYFLGDEVSYLWKVDRAGVRSYRLAGRQEIEAAALRLYERLHVFDFQATSAREEAARELSRMVLGPVWSSLSGNRVAVVPDGGLQYIPFSALPIPDGDSGGPWSPLILRSEVVHLPSASSMARLRSWDRSRSRRSHRVLVFADPVFRLDDPRVETLAETSGSLAAAGAPDPTSAPGDLLRAPDLARLGRLPWSRREAETVQSLAPGGQVLAALDFDASRRNVLHRDLSPFSVIHFATHGLIDDTRPELSGLVLSLVDPQGRLQEGFLGLHDIYRLPLEADLVVLSGCRTALGKEVRGEGLSSLAQSFMYAGTPRVVASLWSVQDRATAELMTAFYRGLWEGNLRPAEALRQAQLSLLRTRRWSHPFFWAAFVHQGDWR